MSTTYFIAGSIFFIAFIAYQVTKRLVGRDKHKEKIIKEGKNAIDNEDTGGLLNSLRKRLRH